MKYLDTSLIVSALSTESATQSVQIWLTSQDPSTLLISQWTVTEVSSALALKLRTKAITLDDRARALTIFRQVAFESFVLINVSSEHFRIAARFSDHYELGLRASDALHLAVASEYGATIYTLDRRLAEAGPPLGVSTRLLL